MHTKSHLVDTQVAVVDAIEAGQADEDVVDGREQQEDAGIVADGEGGHELGHGDVERGAVAALGAGDEVGVPGELGVLVSDAEDGSTCCMDGQASHITVLGTFWHRYLITFGRPAELQFSENSVID